MTRRPIFIGVATVLALAMTAGLAYGAGRLVGTQGRNAHTVGYQQTGATSVMPGSSSSHRGQTFQGSGYASAFRSQMRGWMRDWMRDHSNSAQSWRGSGYGRQGAGQSSRGPSSGTSGGTSHGDWDEHHRTSGQWNGPTTGGYGSGGYHHDGDGWDDHCW